MPRSSLLTRRSFLSTVAGATVSVSLLGRSSPALSDISNLGGMLDMIRQMQSNPGHQQQWATLSRAIYPHMAHRALGSSTFGQLYKPLSRRDQRLVAEGMAKVFTAHLYKIFTSHQIAAYDIFAHRNTVLVQLVESNISHKMRLLVTPQGQVYDVEMNGVSLLSNLRYQTQNLYQQTGGNVRAILSILINDQR